MSATKFAALDASTRSSEFWGNKQPKCPHCGSDFDIDRNEAWFLYDDSDRHTVECPVCEQEFDVVSWASWTFHTDEQERP